MKLETIYLSNVLEGYFRNYDRLSQREKKAWYQYDFYEANRAALYGDDNKVIVTSYPINREYLSDLSKTAGWQRVINLYPDNPHPSISEDLRQNAQLRNEFVRIIKENPKIKLIQYRTTPEFQRLAAWLKKQRLNFKTPELISEENEFILEYYNTKRGFRHLWSTVLGEGRKDINIPKGFICGNLDEAFEAAWWFKSRNQNFVLKYNRGVQGVGVSLNYAKDFAADKSSFKSQLKTNLKEGFWSEPAVIVEELIIPDPNLLGGSPNVELFIDELGKVIFSYPCEQILEHGKKFIGVKIHPELLKYPQMQAAKNAGLEFGQALAQKGYRGCFDIDLVIDKKGRVYAVEANLRRTGGTHLHEFGTSLLGKNYYQTFYLISLDLALKKPIDYQQFKKWFEADLYNRNNKQGLVLANADLLSQQILVPLIIGKSWEQAEALWRRLNKKLKDNLVI